MNDKQRYIFIDTETTGLDPRTHDVIEVAALVYEDGTEICRYNCEMSAAFGAFVDLEALQVNKRAFAGDVGETDDRVIRKNILYGLAEFLIEYSTRDVIFVGHNVQFDIDFIYHTLIKEGIDAKRLLKDRRRIDTKQIALFLTEAGHIQPKSYHLNELVSHVKGKIFVDHKAMNDAMATKDLFYKMTEMV